MLAEILEPIMGMGLIPADLETWKPRRRAIVPAFHKAYLEAMVAMFGKCTHETISTLEALTESCQVGSCPLHLHAMGFLGYGLHVYSAERSRMAMCIRKFQDPVELHLLVLPGTPCRLRVLCQPSCLQAQTDMEEVFLNLGLDIIGLGVFNYDFNSITKESPVIKAWP